jgi:excisionase family DNA binding protein
MVGSGNRETKMDKITAAEILGVSTKTVSKYTGAGYLRVNYVAGKGVYNDEEVRQLKVDIASGAVIIGVTTPQFEGREGKAEVRTENREPEQVKVVGSGNKEVGTQLVKTESLPASHIAGSGNREVGTGNNFFYISATDLQSVLDHAQGNTIQELAAKPLLTFAEAAQLTGLSERSLRNDSKAGKLKAVRQGRADRIARKNLDKYLNAIHE